MSTSRPLVPGVMDSIPLEDGWSVIELGLLADIPPCDLDMLSLGHIGLARVEDLIDAESTDLSEHPHVQRQAARAQWRLAPWDDLADLLTNGAPILELHGGEFQATWHRDGESSTVQWSPHALLESLLGAEPDLPTVFRWAETGALTDRILRALTDDAVELRDIELARWVDQLATAELDDEEKLLQEIAQYAAKLEIRAAVDQLSNLEESGTVAPFGPVTVILDEAFALPSASSTAGDTQLHVPPRRNYLAQSIHDWEPATVVERRERAFANVRAKIERVREQQRRRQRISLIALGLILALGAATFILQWFAA